jgi:hypothetical protein
MIKKSTLVILAAVILFGFSFHLSSCKKCSKDQSQPKDKTNGADVVGDGDTTSKPPDASGTSSGNITQPEDSQTQEQPQEQQIDAQLDEAAKHAVEVAYWTDMVGTNDPATPEQRKKYYDNMMESWKKVRMCPNQPNQYMAKHVKAIDLLYWWVSLKMREARVAYEKKTGFALKEGESKCTATMFMDAAALVFDNTKKADNVGALELAKARYALAVETLKVKGYLMSPELLTRIDIK